MSLIGVRFSPFLTGCHYTGKTNRRGRGWGGRVSSYSLGDLLGTVLLMLLRLP